MARWLPERTGPAFPQEGENDMAANTWEPRPNQTNAGRALKVCIVGAPGKLGQYMVQQALDRG